MNAETITAISNALSGPASGLFVMGMLLFGLYKVGITVLVPFLTSVADSIKDGFEKQSTSLAVLVDEVKQDREHHRTMSVRIDRIESDVTDIKTTVTDIQKSLN